MFGPNDLAELDAPGSVWDGDNAQGFIAKGPQGEYCGIVATDENRLAVAVPTPPAPVRRPPQRRSPLRSP